MEISQEGNQYVIRIPVGSVDAVTLENLLRQLRLQEALAGRQGTDEQAADLAREVNAGWWSRNKQRFIP